jgi:energy-converting hydrogenase Eha subunit F
MLLNFGPKPEFKRVMLDRTAKAARAIPRVNLAEPGEVQCEYRQFEKMFCKVIAIAVCSMEGD